MFDVIKSRTSGGSQIWELPAKDQNIAENLPLGSFTGDVARLPKRSSKVFILIEKLWYNLALQNTNFHWFYFSFQVYKEEY